MMILGAESLPALSDLHDCDLYHLSYDVSSPHERTLTLLVERPNDSIESGQQSSRLRIQAGGVHLFKYTAWGHCLGAEVFHSWQEGVSSETETELQRGKDAGLAVPTLAFTATFHSGSRFELVCKDIHFEVVQYQ